MTVVLTNEGSPPLQLFLRPPVAVQPNGGFVGLRSVTNVAGRCNPDGSVDNSFVTPVVGTNDTFGITDIAAQPDGKVIVGSGPSTASPFQGLRDGLFRLNADGSHDTTFQVKGPFDVLRVRVLSDSKVLVLLRNSVARLLPDGTVDATFHAPSVTASDFGLQSNGKIVLVGPFTTVDGFHQKSLARLDSSGFLDTFFNPVLTVQGPRYVRIQSDDSIILGYDTFLSRFYSDGKSDEFFLVPGGSRNIYGVGVDLSDRVYFNWGSAVKQYSGRNRIRVPAADISVSLQQSQSIDGPWSTIRSIAANGSSDLLLPNTLGPGNAFFRTVPAQ